MCEIMPNWKFEKAVYHKGVCGCGATTYALLQDPMSVTVLVPRITLLQNKAAQTPDSQMVYGDIESSEILDYIERHRGRRMTFLSTWDSAPRLRRLLGDDIWIRDMHIYVDEYQLMISDANIRSYVILSLVECVRDAQLVTFLSATPGLPELLERVPFLKDLPYIELDWEVKEKVEIHSVYTKNPIDALAKVIKMYQQKEYPIIMKEDGISHQSKTMNAFFSSVNGILSVVSSCGLSPEDTTIICSPTDENVKALEAYGFKIGEPPQKNKPRTTYLFATSTSYVGADFYSKDACTFVVADGRKRNLAVDISTELVQICSRERLEENHFRRAVVFLYRDWDGGKDIDESLETIREKYEMSREEMKLFNQKNISESLRKRLVRLLTSEKKAMCDINSYTYWDDVDKKFKLNELSVISDEYEARVQYGIYRDGTYVLRNLEDEDSFTINDRGSWAVAEHVKNLVVKTTFAEKMEQYCKYRQQTLEENFMATWFAAQLERQNESLRVYYDELGAERIKALGYKEKSLQAEMKAKKVDCYVRAAIDKIIKKTGREHTAQEWKEILRKVYEELKIDKKPVRTNLEKLYGYKMKQHHRSDNFGNRYYTHEIVI